jgi:transposase
MRTRVAQRRDFHGLEVRRRIAARLFAAGKETQAAIARRLQVSRQSVMRWYRAWRRGGQPALRGAGRAGRTPKLQAAQWRQVDAALRQGPEAHGFATALWTLPRVARLIERLTGVRYHPAHVGRLLGALDWTLPRPAPRAKERHEAAIRYGKTHRWPTVKKTPAAAERGSSFKTKAASPSARPSAAPGRRAGRRRS